MLRSRSDDRSPWSSALWRRRLERRPRARRASSRGRRLAPADAPELHAIVERLCVVADLPKPTLVLERAARCPNSWIEGTRRGGFRLHLTQGLLDLLEPRELEAVIAHELAHVANRDAAVMTVVGGPGEALLSGGLRRRRPGLVADDASAARSRRRSAGSARSAPAPCRATASSRPTRARSRSPAPRPRWPPR